MILPSHLCLTRMLRDMSHNRNESAGRKKTARPRPAGRRIILCMMGKTVKVFRGIFLAGLLTSFTLTLLGCSGSSSSTSMTTQPENPIGPNLTKLSSDPHTVAPAQHATEVEPHVLANGNTLVAAFQTGRIAPGGATDIGWATSTDGGTTWTHGFLPGLTIGEGSGPYDAASDPVVAYDAKHGI